MARYAKVERRIIKDASYRSLSSASRFLFVTLLIHPSMTPFGALDVHEADLIASTGLSKQRLRKGLAELLAKGLIRKDSNQPVIFLPNYLKHNTPDNPNTVKSWEGYLENLTECDLTTDVIKTVCKFVGTLPASFREALPIGFKNHKNEIKNSNLNHDETVDETLHETVTGTVPETVCLTNNNSNSNSNSNNNSNINRLSSLRSDNLVDFSTEVKKNKTKKEKRPLTFKQQNEKIATEVLQYLNEKSQKRFEVCSGSLKHIYARLAEGATIEDMCLVIDSKCADWLTDPKMSPYLRPQTLFNSEKYPSYLAEAKKSVSNQSIIKVINHNGDVSYAQAQHHHAATYAPQQRGRQTALQAIEQRARDVIRRAYGE